MDLFLIRHGESTKNTRENCNDKLPEHMVSLTEKGVSECHGTGLFLKKYLIESGICIDNCVLWVSPFLVTRQSATIINSYLGINDVREDYSLIEQRHGLFTDRAMQRNRMLFKDEFEFYENYLNNNGEFYAKLPQGEAPMDVAIRTRQFLNMICLEEKNPIFVISHDITIKTIVMNAFNFSPEWFNQEENMLNGSIRLINNKEMTDRLIHGGKTKRLQ